MNSGMPLVRVLSGCLHVRFAFVLVGLAGLSGLAIALGSCAPAPMVDAGVTTGGQQDIAAARAAIEAGEVPDPGSITVEGFLSEHDLPVEEPADPGLLYATAAAAWHQDFDAFTPLATVQIGFGTTIDAASFVRDPLNLCLVIDRSGSMGYLIDQRSGTSKLDAVKIAIDRLLAQLTADDRVSIVTFASRPTTRLRAAAGHDIAAIKSALDPVTAEGGTDLDRGLRRAYRVVREYRNSVRADRLLVFTDAQLTDYQQSDAIDFINVMELYAADNIGATVFGIGTDFGHDVTREISQVRGGNYFFLSDYDRIVSVFDEEFDFLVTPVAYDVNLEVAVPFLFDVVDVHGIEVEEPIPHVVELTIPTLFLSRRQGGGAIIVRMRAGATVDFDYENNLADISLSYTSRDGNTVTPPAVSASLPTGLDPDAGESYFESEAARRAVLLVNTALALKNSCTDAYYDWSDWYYEPPNRTRAIDRLTEFLPYFDDLAEGLEDQLSPSSRSLSQERSLLEKLLANVTNWY